MPVQYEDWAPFYADILREFRFDPRADEAATIALASRLGQPPYQPDGVWARAEALLRGRAVTIVGAADDAASALKRERPKTPLVAADGATTACLEVGRRPDLIVSDLDGRVEDEVNAVRDGSLVLVHTHGDNQASIDRWIPKFDPARVAGTCQTRPLRPLRNHGGFTDGDRACFIAHALGAARLRLIGFDFERMGDRYTGTYDPKTKPRKLAWAQRLIQELAARGVLIDRA